MPSPGRPSRRKSSLPKLIEPQEIIDFMCASVAEVLEKEVGKKLESPTSSPALRVTPFIHSNLLDLSADK